jgi:hypothetical protein
VTAPATKTEPRDPIAEHRARVLEADEAVAAYQRRKIALQLMVEREIAPLRRAATMAEVGARVAWSLARQAITRMTEAERDSLRLQWPISHVGACCSWGVEHTPSRSKEPRWTCPLHGVTAPSERVVEAGRELDRKDLGT